MSTGVDEDFGARLSAVAEAVEAVLADALSATPRDGEIARPARLLSAMRHGVLNGGKRLRPFLVVESARLFGLNSDADANAALRVAAALECIHCYSLIHDDLPAMDDDALRRGQPTVHIAYDEATAILAGDALQTLAFDLIADDATALPDCAKVSLIRALARASGLGGMAGGQALDLAAEHEAPDAAGIVTLQAMKTGALLRFACEAGAIAAGAGRADVERLSAFGSTIGLAFQLADDLLDLTASPEALGKATGKDAARGKGTLVALHGEAWARKRLAELVASAEETLSVYRQAAETLIAAARFVADRRT